MAKNKRTRRKPSREPSADRQRADLRRAEVATVGWSLCVMTALGAQLAAGFVALLAWGVEEPVAWNALSRLLILAAAFSGLLSLLLLPLVIRLREDRLPRGLIGLALAISAVPAAVVAWLLAR